MQEILLKYHPVPRLPFCFRVRGKFPASWEELTPRQLVALSGLSERDSLHRLVHRFTGIPRGICRCMDLYQLSRIWWLSDWISASGSLDRFIIPRIPAGGNVLCSPCPGLRKVTFGQFVFFDTCYIRYAESKSPQDLDRFVASLYLPEGAAFSDELPLTLEPFAEKIPPKIKQAVLFNYTLVRRWLAGIYPLLFALPEDENQPDEKRKTAPKADPSVWIKVFENLVGDDITRHEEYGRIPLHNVLRFLTTRTKENIKTR